MQLNDIKTNGMSAHAKYGTWLLDQGLDKRVVFHLSGRKFLTNDQREEKGYHLNKEQVEKL